MSLSLTTSGMDPENVSTWLPIVRDLAMVAIAALILLHETLFNHDPNAVLIAAGLSLLGIPAAIRADSKRTQKNGNPDGEDERWSHLP